MRRTLPLAPVLVLLLLVVPPTEASTPPPNTVWTVFTTVEAVVEGSYAVVQVTAEIANRGPDPEFPFEVRVPDDAFVTGLTIERDGVVHEARIAPREEARQEYEAHKAQEQTGGLVEKQRRASVYAFLVNVAEFTNVKATLTYERYLAAERGVHNLSLEAPVSGFGRDLGARFVVDVRNGDEGVAGAWSFPDAGVHALDGGYRIVHEVGPRPDDASTPFQVSYALPPTPDAGSLHTMVHDGTGYFAHRFRAPSGARDMPLDLVLALDVSGSMNGLKVEQMRDAAVQVLQSLRPEDRLHLVFFSSGASSPWDGLREMTSAARREAADEVSRALVAGSTNLEAALREGFRGFDGVDWAREEGRLPALVLLTDGQPTVGMTDRAALRQLARDANDHEVPVFAIAFGNDADWTFVHGIAQDGEGAAIRVPEGAGAEVDLRRFLDALTAPVLKDVRVEYPEGATAYRAGAPILFAGSELLVVGTFDPARGLPGATVRALGPDGARTVEVDAAEARTASLPRVVAYHEVRRLQDLMAAEGEKKEWVDEVVRLSLAHGFVTDHTSLVLTLEPRDPRAAPAQGCAGCNGTWNAFTLDSSGEASDGRAALRTVGSPAPGAAGMTAPTTTPTGWTTTTAEPTPRVPGPGALAALAALAVVAGLMRRRA